MGPHLRIAGVSQEQAAELQRIQTYVLRRIAAMHREADHGAVAASEESGGRVEGDGGDGGEGLAMLARWRAQLQTLEEDHRQQVQQLHHLVSV
jgi:hypothetical protein